VKEEELEVSDLAGYKYKEERVNHHGIPQRWLIVESQKRKKSDLEKLVKKRKQEQEKIEKKLKKWQKGKEENLEELKVEVKPLKKTLIYHQLTDDKFFIQTDKKGKETYGYQGQIRENLENIEAASAQAGRFILATNVLDESELSSLDILQKYKEQQGCERGFRFLKDPLFFADSVFLKTPRRIETMAMLMGLCLLVYSLGQRQIRQELIKRKETVQNQVGKSTSSPTLRWIFQVLQGIHLVNLNQEIIVSGLTEEIRDILKYFSIYCQSYYGI
jgi:transposase